MTQVDMSAKDDNVRKRRPCKVLHIVTALNVGGIETYLLRLLKHADPRRFAMDVCYESPKPGEYEEAFREHAHTLFRMPGKIGFAGYIWRLSRLLKAHGYDAVSDFTGDFAGASMLAARIAGVNRRLAFYRSSGISHQRDPLRMLYRRCVRRLVVRYATAILSNSDSNLQAFYPHQQPGNGKYHVVPNGIDLEEFKPVDNHTRCVSKARFGLKGRFVIGHVGGFKPVKNHLFMLHIFERFHRRYPNISLLLIGDGALRKKIESEISQKQLEDCVVLAGCRTDVAQCLAAMDIFWFPSLFEGLPNAMIEAQAAGLPIVASLTDSITEHIPSSGLSYTIDLKDDDAWLKRLTFLVDSELERISQGGANRKHAELHYSLQPRLDEFLAYIEKDPSLPHR